MARRRGNKDCRDKHAGSTIFPQRPEKGRTEVFNQGLSCLIGLAESARFVRRSSLPAGPTVPLATHLRSQDGPPLHSFRTHALQQGVDTRALASYSSLTRLPWLRRTSHATGDRAFSDSHQPLVVQSGTLRPLATRVLRSFAGGASVPAWIGSKGARPRRLEPSLVSAGGWSRTCRPAREVNRQEGTGNGLANARQ